jgi:formylmethanofuran dehydrogenase subunit E
MIWAILTAIFRRKEYELFCMRLSHMFRVHPQQIEDKCSKCGEIVGVYPSGQCMLKKHKGHIKIICNVCAGTTAVIGDRIPGFENEGSESVWVQRRRAR